MRRRGGKCGGIYPCLFLSVFPIHLPLGPSGEKNSSEGHEKVLEAQFRV